MEHYRNTSASRMKTLIKPCGRYVQCTEKHPLACRFSQRTDRESTGFEGKEMLKQQKYILSYRLVSAKDSLPIEKHSMNLRILLPLQKANVIPQLLTKVIDNLKRNHIELHRFEKDSLLSVYAYTLKAPKIAYLSLLRKL